MSSLLDGPTDWLVYRVRSNSDGSLEVSSGKPGPKLEMASRTVGSPQRSNEIHASSSWQTLFDPQLWGLS